MKKHSASGVKSPPTKAAHDKFSAPSSSTATAPASEHASARPEVLPSAAVCVAEPALAPPPADLQTVRIGYFQPAAREVFVVGSFNHWNPRATPLRRDAVGDWSVELSLPRGQYHYRLMVDGEWRDDPTAQQTALNPYGGFDAVLVVT